MFQFQGIWLPDGEKHFPEWMHRNGEIIDGRGTYQIRKLREALTHVREFRVAVDVGAHVGLWAMHLAKRFEEVIAFEPVDDFRRCFAKNVLGENIVLHDYALGAEERRARMHLDPADTGGTHVDEAAAGERDVRVVPLDHLELDDVDFIKIDCEGYEHKVVAGALETIARCRPCIIVEQKPHKLGPNFGIKGTPAVDLLRELGMVQRREMGGDFIMAFP